MQNKNYKSIAIKLLILSLLIFNALLLNGCNNTLASNHYPYSSNKSTANGAVQEYINRVAKRLLIVTDNPRLAKLNINLQFKNSSNPTLYIDYPATINHRQAHSIVISKGLLNYLQDEAELAAIIAIALETLASNQIASNNYPVATSADRRIINQLYRAGYDPAALIELQEEHLTNHKQQNWLGFLFDPINITHPRVTTNKAYIRKHIPKGLQRGKQNYLSNVYLIKR